MFWVGTEFIKLINVSIENSQQNLRENLGKTNVRCGNKNKQKSKCSRVLALLGNEVMIERKQWEKHYKFWNFLKLKRVVKSKGKKQK